MNKNKKNVKNILSSKKIANQKQKRKKVKNNEENYNVQLNYFNPNTATNSWIWSRPLIKTIGKHRFSK